MNFDVLQPKSQQRDAVRDADAHTQSRLQVLADDLRPTKTHQNCSHAQTDVATELDLRPTKTHQNPPKNGHSQVLALPKRLATFSRSDQAFATVLHHGWRSQLEAVSCLRTIEEFPTDATLRGLFTESQLNVGAKNIYVATRKVFETRGEWDSTANELAKEIYDYDSPLGIAEAKAIITAQSEAYTLTDEGNARRFIAANAERVRYVPKWKRWQIYDGTRWAEPERGEIEQLACKVPDEILHEATVCTDLERRKALIAHATKSQSAKAERDLLAKASTKRGVAMAPTDFDADVWALNCASGTVDLKTGQTRAHAPGDHITKIAPAGHHHATECPTWRKFLCDIFEGDAQTIAFMQRALGYAIAGDCREQILIVLFGMGANGKSTLLDIVADAVGDYSLKIEAKTLLARDGDRISNDIARLRGARFVMASETGNGRRLDEEKVKALTGDAKLTGEFKYGEAFTFDRTFTLFLATNHRPEIRGTDDGIWRRVYLVPFDVRFWNPDKGESGPEHLQQDKSLFERLRAERDGILAWLVQGCLEWQRDGLNAPPKVLAATAAYRAESDVIGRFISEKCTVGATFSVPAGMVYEEFKAWCKTNGEPEMTAKDFGISVRERDNIEAKRNKNGIVYWGVGLLAD